MGFPPCCPDSRCPPKKILHGCVRVDALKQVALSRDKLFAALRDAEMLHLGQLRRVYLEAAGQFSLVQRKRPVPGLSLMPDTSMLVEGLQRDPHHRACAQCGHVIQVHRAEPHCGCCGAGEWVTAVNSREG